jgi:hypothetical protein
MILTCIFNRERVIATKMHVRIAHFKDKLNLNSLGEKNFILIIMSIGNELIMYAMDFLDYFRTNSVCNVKFW